MTTYLARELPAYRILVTGWRHWPAELAWFVEYQLREEFGNRPAWNLPTVVVHGACPVGDGGVDGIADRFARSLPPGAAVAVEPYPADFAGRGPGAGPERNTRMVAAGAHVCLAFPGPGAGHSGTWDCIRKAVNAGIPTRIWNVDVARRLSR